MSVQEMVSRRRVVSPPMPDVGPRSNGHPASLRFSEPSGPGCSNLMRGVAREGSPNADLHGVRVVLVARITDKHRGHVLDERLVYALEDMAELGEVVDDASYLPVLALGDHPLRLTRVAAGEAPQEAHRSLPLGAASPGPRTLGARPTPGARRSARCGAKGADVETTGRPSRQGTSDSVRLPR